MIFLPLMLAVSAIGCAAPNDQTTLNICAGQSASAADKAMNAQWRTTLAFMHKEDKQAAGDGSRASGPSYSDALLASQRAWLQYRDSECRMESYAARGGSMQPMLEAQCQGRLTQARSRQLAQFVKDD